MGSPVWKSMYLIWIIKSAASRWPTQMIASIIKPVEGIACARGALKALCAAVASPQAASDCFARRTHANAITMAKQYTRKEVSERNTKKDAVFIIDNVVYDVTPFIDEHPGGHEVLVNVAGKDASEDFEDIGHSLDAKELMKKFQIGELVSEDRIERQRRSFNWETNNTESESTFVGSWKFPLVLGILMTVLYSYVFG